MRRAAEHLAELVDSLPVRTVYTDLDGTLLGPGGSLFATPAGPSVEATEAVSALLEGGVDLVVVSGRTRDQIREVARVVGATAYVAELGGLVVYRHEWSEEVVRADAVRRGRGTAAEAIDRSGAAGFLLEAYPGRLEPHAPWAFLGRECSILLRGNVDVDAARAGLRAAGYGWLDLLDNGILSGGRERFPALDVDEVRVYHLMPAGVSKRSAIALDRARRELGTDECILIGDSPSDADAAAEVGAVFVVANGAPALGGEHLADNVFLLERTHGLGFADAVLPFVAARRAAGRSLRA